MVSEIFYFIIFIVLQGQQISFNSLKKMSACSESMRKYYIQQVCCFCKCFFTKSFSCMNILFCLSYSFQTIHHAVECRGACLTFFSVSMFQESCIHDGRDQVHYDHKGICFTPPVCTLTM